MESYKYCEYQVELKVFMEYYWEGLGKCTMGNHWWWWQFSYKVLIEWFRERELCSWEFLPTNDNTKKIMECKIFFQLKVVSIQWYMNVPLISLNLKYFNKYFIIFLYKF